MMAKTAEDYLGLPYHIVLVRDRSEDGDEGWVAAVEELPGALSQGKTAADAVENVRDAMLGWIDVMLQDGKLIPEPRPEQHYSGKFVVRLSPSLHEALVKEADREGVSLNQFVASALAGAIGWRSAKSELPEQTGEWVPSQSHGVGEQQTGNSATQSVMPESTLPYMADVPSSFYDMPLERLAGILAERLAREVGSRR
jgi:predicted RNase H-like HicB family nuclease